jgi:hypothetical protein
MKNDKHLEVIERATSIPIKSNSDFIYVFENGTQVFEERVKRSGLDKLVDEYGYVKEIKRRDGI